MHLHGLLAGGDWAHGTATTLPEEISGPAVRCPGEAFTHTGPRLGIHCCSTTHGRLLGSLLLVHYPSPSGDPALSVPHRRPSGLWEAEHGRPWRLEELG